MSGEEARLVVARDLVEVRPYWTLARDRGLVPPGVVFQQVSTGFLVRPRAAGEQITVEVVPWFSYLGPDGPGDVRFTEAATTLRVPEGQTVDLAGTSFQTEASRRAFGLVMAVSWAGRTTGLPVSEARIPKAMARSKRGPSLRISPGARLTVTRREESA